MGQCENAISCDPFYSPWLRVYQLLGDVAEADNRLGNIFGLEGKGIKQGAGIIIEELPAGAELRAAGGELPDHLLGGDAAAGHRAPRGLAPPPLRQGVQEARPPERRHGQAGQQAPGGHNTGETQGK